MADKGRLSTAYKMFIKAMVVTVCVIFLVLIGYFTAGYLFGGL